MRSRTPWEYLLGHQQSEHAPLQFSVPSFPPAEPKALCGQLEFIYTPKHVAECGVNQVRHHYPLEVVGKIIAI